ncbi:MAG: hypothetical protein S4CHLAM45_09060 [Chlamydiales bacterium]|nr:hypothetical protein [Chlamydiales bacterium]MCH9620542.1 hypothetical protein [Chlamydiales bacterium]MCH9623010.1 hypothetical protein [Chlamydiales bacterium]
MHDKKVERLRKKLQDGRYHTLSHSVSNTLRNGKYKKGCVKLKMDHFDNILEVNEAFALVEPKVTFYELVKATLKKGLIPAVVPEFKSITVGGAIMGAALESSSHQYGQFSDCCLEYELVLGNGSVVTVSPEKDPDLFYGVSGSYGTLALITLAKVRLIKTKPFVSLTYTPKFPVPTSDFCEGVALGPEEIITIDGTLIDHPDSPVVRLNRPFSPWFIDLIEKKPKAHCMPILDYLFRFDRGAFWMGRSVRRFLFGPLFNSHRLYQGLHKLPAAYFEKQFFIHDFYVPMERAEEAFACFSKKSGISPIWLCPIKGTTTPQFLSPHYGHSSYLNIGIYGKAQDPVKLSQELEKDVLSFGGRKMLYSLTYYSQKSFEEEYDNKRYCILRKKCYAENAFPSLYSKICPKPIPLRNTISETT